jgi:hypothetical protein
VAVFWKDAVFFVNGCDPVCANDSSPCVVVPLQHRFSGKIIVFGATHLKSKPSEANELRRESQVAAILDMMTACLSTCGGESMMLLGDFNADAFSGPKLEAKVVPYVLNWRDGCLSHTYPLPTRE